MKKSAPHGAAAALYPGSFDPPTLGHLDLIERASRTFERLIVAVLQNVAKEPAFDAELRRLMIEDAVRDVGLENVEVASFDGLLIDFARARGCRVIVRGLRAISDLEYELQMALMNRRLDPHVETVFLSASEDVSFISSRLVREIARFGGDVSSLVPRAVLPHIARRFGARKGDSR
ncbi:MAG: pantetheine-phosphate adenylyltransferase [Acidobacteriota bacterium]|nr:pantetheine-phosphate adenylyltransferase [Acidobacteriota bacterium]